MSANAQQTEWVQRVLQFKLGPVDASASKGEDADKGTPVAVWNSAKEKVDQQLSALYNVLRKSGIPVLGIIANEIEGVMSNYRVAMTKALMDFESAGPETKGAARANVLKAISTYKASLPKDKFIIGADSNPFKVSVNARQTFGAALDEISSKIGAN